MNLPTIEEVEQLWDEWHVPDNIRGHLRQVSKVVVFLAKKLKEKGIDVNVDLAERSALLHDLLRMSNTKNFEFELQKGYPSEDIEFWKQLTHKYGKIHHGKTAASILKGKYPEVAEVILGHTIENIKDNILNASWEAKLLVYADTRVLHDKIVNFEDRIANSKKRHGWFYDKLKKDTGIDYFEITHANVKKVEDEIFNIIEISPEDVNNID